MGGSLALALDGAAGHVLHAHAGKGINDGGAPVATDIHGIAAILLASLGEYLIDVRGRQGLYHDGVSNPVEEVLTIHSAILRVTV
jgi:hypothetical protein